MTDGYINLFVSLFKYHPRESLTSYENFLTEAIAYILKTEPSAMNAWLSLMLDRTVEVNDYSVLTQNSERIEDSGQVVFPDLKVIARSDTGTQTIYCEHKWDSPCNHDQLHNYAYCAQGDSGHSVVTFVGANRRQILEARKLQPQVVQKAVYWEDIYRSFKKIGSPSKILEEFIAFMAIQNIGSNPMDSTNLRSLAKAQETMRQFWKTAHRLLDEFSWDFSMRVIVLPSA